MKNTHVLRSLTRVTVILAALLALLASTGQHTYAAASTTASTPKFNISKAITAIPLKQYAQKLALKNGKVVSAATGQSIPPCLTSGIAPRCYSPQQINKAYGITKSGETGKGRTIVIIDASSSPTLQTDIHFYDQLYGLKDPKLNVFAPFGLPPVNGAYVETALDIETAHAIAPDATIDLVVTGDTSLDTTDEQFFTDLLKPVQYAIDNNLGDSIDISYGGGESCFDSSYFQLQHQVFSSALAKHISIMVSSGDSGAAIDACAGGPNGPVSEALGVNALTADPLVTSVGGTSLNLDTSGKYIGETTWDSLYYGEGTGGGFSTYYPRPAYQNSVTNNPHRGVPDVAWVADPNTGVPVVFSEGGATLIVPVGGTSVGAPAWAAISALANQKAGKRLGFLNASIYRILQSTSYSKAFNDIITGDNSVVIYDSTGNQVYIPGYAANTGWDPVTGVGTPIVNNLLGLLAKYVQTSDGNGP